MYIVDKILSNYIRTKKNTEENIYRKLHMFHYFKNNSLEKLTCL